MSRGEFHSNDDDETFWEKYRALIIIAMLVLAVGGWILSQVLVHKKAAPAKLETFTMVTLPPPPPPPPKPTPPPPQATPPPVDQKMDQRPMEPQEEVKPDEAPPKPDTPPDQPLGTNNTGPGPGDNFGLGGPGGSGGFGGGGKGGSGSKYGWYAGQVQRRVSDALQKNRATRTASLRVEVRIWPDSTGRVTRAEMKTSTGDAALDAAIQSNVLNGLQLDSPPPSGMPLPIVLRLTARKAI
ncbi:MAG: TonB C-terminal domain-containing protein [Chthoniobacterales bacterium]